MSDQDDPRWVLGEEKDGHRTCWGCAHLHVGPMPRRVCSARAWSPFIYLPYGELTPAHGYDDGYGHAPKRTVADDCDLYVRGLFVQCDMQEAEEETQDVMRRQAEQLVDRFPIYPEFRRVLADEEDTYKPFYRGIAILLGNGGIMPGASREAVMEVLREAHPYFVGALARDPDMFDHLYEDFIDLYPSEDANAEDDLDV